MRATATALVTLALASGAAAWWRDTPVRERGPAPYPFPKDRKSVTPALKPPCPVPPHGCRYSFPRLKNRSLCPISLATLHHGGVLVYHTGPRPPDLSEPCEKASVMGSVGTERKWTGSLFVTVPLFPAPLPTPHTHLPAARYTPAYEKTGQDDGKINVHLVPRMKQRFA